MGMGLRFSNNPKRQFSRKHRRRHNPHAPHHVLVVTPKQGFFAQHALYFRVYVVALLLVPFCWRDVHEAAIVCALSLIAPLLWFVRYKRAQKLLTLDDPIEVREVVEQLS